MAKATATTETQENVITDGATATATAKKAKAKSGTSFPARAKQYLLNLAIWVESNIDNFGFDFFEVDELKAISKNWSENSSKGLPLKMQIENASARIKELLKTAILQDGEMVFPNETDAAKYENLLSTKKRLHAAFAKENAPVTNPKTADAQPE